MLFTPHGTMSLKNVLDPGVEARARIPVTRKGAEVESTSVSSTQDSRRMLGSFESGMVAAEGTDPAMSARCDAPRAACLASRPAGAPCLTRKKIVAVRGSELELSESDMIDIAPLMWVSSGSVGTLVKSAHPLNRTAPGMKRNNNRAVRRTFVELGSWPSP